jgi:hypothetical protein
MRVTKCLDVNESAAVFSNSPAVRPEEASYASQYLEGYLHKSNVSVNKLFSPDLMSFYFRSKPPVQWVPDLYRG